MFPVRFPLATPLARGAPVSGPCAAGGAGSFVLASLSLTYAWEQAINARGPRRPVPSRDRAAGRASTSRWGQAVRLCLAGALLALSPVARPVAAATIERVEGHLTIALSAAPGRPREGDRVRYTVRLVDALGRPADRVKVRLTAAMTDGMVIRADLAPGPEPGTYAGTLLFTMAGRWQVELSIRGPVGSVRTVFDELVAPR